MEAPKCKLCGERHYGMCPSVKAFIAAADTPSYRKALASITPAEAAKIREGKFDRTAYQRELMRRRRAAATSTSTTTVSPSWAWAGERRRV